MPLSAPTLEALQQLMAHDQTLLAQVQATDNATQAAALIAPAAASHGIPVTQAELLQHLEQASAAATQQALSDQQLEAVAGGLKDDAKMICISIISLGIGCAAVSIGQAIKVPFLNPDGSPMKKYC